MYINQYKSLQIAIHLAISLDIQSGDGAKPWLTNTS